LIEIKSLTGIIFLIGIVILQIFLSKRENKWFGLILPIINIIYSIMAVLGLAAFMGQAIGEIIMALIMVFLVTNISTVILLAIYFACREKFKKKKELDKMNIQDLGGI
jgi:predicted RND superfamily exporter protein